MPDLRPESGPGPHLRRVRGTGRLSAAIALWLFIVLAPVSAFAGGQELQPASYGYFDFPTCLRYALVHSDFLLDSRIEVQMKSIGLKDAHSQILPTVELATRYYLARTNETSGNRFNVSFFMRNWNPYLALFKIKAQSVMVDMATIAHSRKISEGIARLAKVFYKIHVTEKQLRLRKQKLAISHEQVNYGKSRHEQGVVDDVTLRTWQNNLRAEKLALKNLESSLDKSIADLKNLIGYHPDYYLPLDTRDAVNQILGGFNGQLVTFGDIQGSNLALKFLAKKQQLESVQISGAYFLLLPQPLLVFESISNQPDRASGFNMALGVDYTLWDGFRRVRDIKRKRMVLEKIDIDRRETSRKLYGAYRNLTTLLDLSGEREAIMREKVKLAEIGEERALLTYKSGDSPFERYLGSRIGKVDADLSAISILEPRVMALIDLATLAGGLDKFNVRIQH